jgi:hypothetical protein
MEQCAVVQVLTLKKLFVRNVTAELEGVCGHEALSLWAVKKWRERFVDGRIPLTGGRQPGRPPQSDLYESLRALIDETPFILGKHICQKLRIPKTTCLRILHEDPGFRKCYFRVDSTFDDGERGLVSGHIFRGTSTGRAPCLRDKLRTFINWG